MEGEGGAFVSLDEVVTRILNKSNMKDNKTPNLLEGRTKEWNYYDRPSIHTSYQIAASCMAVMMVMIIGWGVLKLVEKVSDDRNDFDNTYNKINKDIPIDTLYNRQEHLEGSYNELTSIFTSKRVSRALNEPITTYLKRHIV